jgi:hemolysin type calcium-binding protein
MNDELFLENAAAGQVDYATGNGGDDTIHTADGDAVAIVSGDDFNPAAAGGGNDTLIAGAGFVQFYGGGGNDQLDASAATGSAVEGNAGNDVILGSPGHDSLYGGAGDDLLTDSAGLTEIFDCGDGTGDVLNDLDGNGTGDNGSGWTGAAEDDSHAGCETINVNTVSPQCSFTPGTSGCVELDGVVAYSGGTGPAYTTLSGSFVFAPITTWDFYTGGTASGSGTWTSSIGTSGTWAAHDQTNTQAYYPRFEDEAGLTTCPLATIRYVGVELTLAGGGLASDAIMELLIRVGATGTNGVYYQAFSATPTGEPLGLHQGTDVSGVTIRC